MRKKFLALMASLAILMTGGLIAVTASPAAAAPTAIVAAEAVQTAIVGPVAMRSYATCPAGQSCLYTGANGAGTQTAKSYSSMLPIASCKTLSLQPIGGYHSAKGGFGSGLTFVIYSDSYCNTVLAFLDAGETYSNEFSRINSILMS